MTRRKSETTLLRARVGELELQAKKTEKEMVALKRILQSTEAELRACDDAIFECIQKSNLASLGRVTDNVMRRQQAYSDGFGAQLAADIASGPIPKKRKTRR